MMVITSPIWMEQGSSFEYTHSRGGSGPEDKMVLQAQRSTVNLMPGLLGIINSLIRLYGGQLPGILICFYSSLILNPGTWVSVKTLSAIFWSNVISDCKTPSHKDLICGCWNSKKGSKFREGRELTKFYMKASTQGQTRSSG